LTLDFDPCFGIDWHAAPIAFVADACSALFPVSYDSNSGGSGHNRNQMQVFVASQRDYDNTAADALS